MNKNFLYLALLSCATTLFAVDAEKKFNKSMPNGRIHAIKPQLTVSMCDRNVINLSAKLYEEVLLLRSENEELRSENAKLRRQLRIESPKNASSPAKRSAR